MATLRGEIGGKMKLFKGGKRKKKKKEKGATVGIRKEQQSGG